MHSGGERGKESEMDESRANNSPVVVVVARHSVQRSINTLVVVVVGAVTRNCIIILRYCVYFNCQRSGQWVGSGWVS